MTQFQPGTYAESDGDRAAVIMGDSGVTVSYREMEDRSRRVSSRQ